MTETFFYDNPEENWKNSEVMQAFIDIYQEPVKEAVAGDLDNGYVTEVDLSDNFNVSEFSATQEALAVVQATLGYLSKVASEAGAVGDGVAAYKIERAIEEVKQVGLNIWSPEDAE